MATLETKKCLVTGAGGLLGRYTLKSLASMNYSVIGLDIQRLTEFAGTTNLKYITADITDTKLISSLVRKIRPDSIVHLAALLTPSIMNDVVYSFKVNVLGTLNLLQAALENGVKRFVYASSMSMYESYSMNVQPKKRFNEEATVSPKNPYTISKYACERMGEYYASKYNIAFTALRFPLIFGAARVGRSGGSIHSSLQKALENGLSMRNIQIGQFPKCELIYVKDAAKSIRLALQRDFVGNRVYNIGSGRLVSSKDVLKCIKDLFKDSEVKAKKSENLVPGGYYSPKFASDYSRATRELGYIPEFDLKEALADYMKEVQIPKNNLKSRQAFKRK